MNEVQIYRPVGEYRHYSYCRFCLSAKLTPVINLGYVPLAGGFLKSQKSFKKEKFYPLELCFCPQCYLLQTNNVVNRDILFKDYYYYSSAIKTLVAFFESVSIELQNIYIHGDVGKKFIIEIGCNDGTMLQLIKEKGFKVLGIDPASNIVKPLIKRGYPIINNYFSEKIAKIIVEKYGKADAIVSFNTLAHIEDMHDIAKGIKILLKKDGFLAFGVHYLGNLIKETQYDMIYHEHQYYYSLLALKNFFSMYDMIIYDVKPINIHAGSMVYYAQNKEYGKRKISKAVTTLIKKERELKLHKIETYIQLSKQIQKTKIDLITLLKKLKKENKIIAGYGASGRGTTIMNYCGLDERFLNYIVDDAPAKQGRFTPGIHFKIFSSSLLKTRSKPDYVLLFAWSFLNEIFKKNKVYLQNKGRFIIPLPKPRIL